MTTQLKSRKKGSYFMLKPGMNKLVSAKDVWIRGDYCRDIKKYEIISADDCCRFRYVKGDRTTFDDFLF